MGERAGAAASDGVRFAVRLLRSFLLLVVGFGLVSAVPPPEPIGWTRSDAGELLQLIETVGSEGLDPADYEPGRLRSALQGGDPAALDAVATALAVRLAGDFTAGHVSRESRISWHITGPSADPERLRGIVARSVAQHRITDGLRELLPRNPAYLALRTALANLAPSDVAGRELLRANLERWRWMPRDLGSRYLLVNVPSFTVDLVENGWSIAQHRIIVGKTSLPTPQFSATVTGVILNPWWNVPQSIIRESVGRLVRNHPARARAQGYVVTPRAGGGIQVSQGPGPKNSLGQMKLVMPNPFAVYLHDTPSKTLFEKPVRTFSHGCIRVDKAFDLAALLLRDVPGWDRAAIDRTVESRETTTISLPARMPVYVAYFTAVPDGAGGITRFDDIYDRDQAVIDRLTDGNGEDVESASLAPAAETECALSARA